MNNQCSDCSFEHFQHMVSTAPRFLRDSYYYDAILLYPDFAEQAHDFQAGKAVPINIFDAIKYIYGISMVDIAVVLNVTFGVVYNAKVNKKIPNFRLKSFAKGLCIPENLLANTATTTDIFNDLAQCKEKFYSIPNIHDTLNSMPDWKLSLADEIHKYIRCSTDTANKFARIDKLFWNSTVSIDEYTDIEQEFIHYITQETSIHSLEYSLDRGGHLKLQIKSLTRSAIETPSFS